MFLNPFKNSSEHFPQSEQNIYLNNVTNLKFNNYPRFLHIYSLQSIHRHVQQSMCYVTYLVQEYVDSYMSQSVKVSFTDIWILSNIVIEKDQIKDVSQIEHFVNL